jgi:L-fuconate dehydratase
MPADLSGRVVVLTGDADGTARECALAYARQEAELSPAIAPVKIAVGEHIPNRVLFKNFIHYGGVDFVQADCTRLAGVSEILTVSLMARKFGLQIVPHVGDMCQLHQHLVLFNHIAPGHGVVFLEYIPHLREHFVFRAQVSGGFYKTPREPGASSDVILAGNEGY